VGASLSHKVVFDGRNLYRKEQLIEAGFDYFGIGQGEKIVEKAKAY